MMDSNKVSLIICLTIFVVIGINAAIYALFSRGNQTGDIELFQRSFKRLRNPWQEEDNNMQELSRLVADLKKHERHDPPE